MHKPMLCQKAEPFSSDAYLFEPKLDGVRCIAHLDKGRVLLYSRSGKDLTPQFPEITYNWFPNGVLDGEIVALNAENRPSFNHIQHRLGRTNPIQIRHGQRVYPVTFFIFDILENDGVDLTQRPLSERKRILWESPLSKLDVDASSFIRLVPHLVGDGLAFFDALVSDGWEGIVAKPLNSLYVPDSRSFWKKAKAKREGVFRICGVTKGKGNRVDGIGALILGKVTDENKLLYAGEVGTGLTFDDLRILPSLLTQSDCPFDSDPKADDFWYWTTPDVLVEIEFFEEFANGRLRFPAVKRIRSKRRR